MEWRLPAATGADAAALSLVAGATFLEAFACLLPGADIVAHCADKSSPAAFARWLDDPASRVVLAEAAGTGAPIGYTVLAAPDLPTPAASDDVELKRIYTLEATHGGGLGRALLERALADAAALGHKRMLLGVYVDNRRARRFYERHGFALIGERPFQMGGQTYLDPLYVRAI